MWLRLRQLLPQRAYAPGQRQVTIQRPVILDHEAHRSCSQCCLSLCCAYSLSHVRPFVTPWTVPCQAPLSMGFSRQEYWSGLLRPPPGDLPNPGFEPGSLMSPALTGRIFTASATWEEQLHKLGLFKIRKSKQKCKSNLP